MLLQPTVNVKIYIHFLYSYGVDASFEMFTIKKIRETQTQSKTIQRILHN